MALSDQQRRFCEGVVSGLNPTDAYKTAGYKAKGHAAESASSRLLRNVEVAQYIDELRAPAIEDAQLTASMIIDGLLVEARYYDQGANHRARVDAWMGLAKIKGMLDGKRDPDSAGNAPGRRTVRYTRDNEAGR